MSTFVYTKNFFITISIVIVVVTAVFISSIHKVYKESRNSDLLGMANDKDAQVDYPLHTTVLFDESSFYKSVSTASSIDRVVDYHIYGGVIPHHLLPSFVISDFFRSLSNQEIKTVVIIGPDHYETGKANIVTSLYAWDTRFGALYPDTTIINTLVGNRVLATDDETVSKDHAVSGIVPFIKYYLPESKIVPVLMSGDTSKEEVTKFIETLHKNYSDNMLIVASVDFSHYLNSEEARRNDDVTLKIIKEFNYDSLFELNSDYLDSPGSVASVMMLMQRLGKTNTEILQHLNSGDITGNEYTETTSYFSIFYY